MSGQTFTTISRKFDGIIHRTWEAELIDETESWWLFLGKFSKTIFHDQIGIIKRNTISLEYFWKDKNYNIFKFYEPDGEFRNFYCNISLPPIISESTLDYVDLDIDVVVWADFSYEILDRDEFEVNSRLYRYPHNFQTLVEKSLNELLNLIQRRDFPFDSVKLKT